MKLLIVIVGSMLVYGILNGETLSQSTDINNKTVNNEEVVSVQQGLKELLTQRINSRWKAVKDNDLKKLYGFFTPAKRKLLDFEDFSKSRGKSVVWQGVKIEDIAFSDRIATVNFTLSYKLSLPDRVAMELNKTIGNIQTKVRERWIYKENNWWFIGEPLIDQK